MAAQRTCTNAEDSKSDTYEGGRWRVSCVAYVRCCAREHEYFCGGNNATDLPRDLLTPFTLRKSPYTGTVSGLGRGPPATRPK